VPDFYPLIRSLLFALPPEKAHSATLAALKTGLLRLRPHLSEMQMACLKSNIAGLEFANPLGMAAGFDKNADIIDGVLNLGFGFTEIGTVTPRPQAGNPRPRLFRLVRDRAIINRMGFNNEGHEAVYRKIAARRAGQGAAAKGVLGVNIGANKDSAGKIADYALGLKKFYAVADYFTVNISSPNTPGLRDLQGRENLRQLLAAVRGENSALVKQHKVMRPIFLKIAPDLTEEGLDDIAAEFLAAPLSGLIISNTTIDRPKLKAKALAAEKGGLSGRPLFNLSTIALAKMRQRLGKSVPLIAAGGVENWDTALAKIQAGADLIQFYTGLVYRGAWAVPQILEGLAQFCQKTGAAHISALRDSEVEYWAAKKLDVRA